MSVRLRKQCVNEKPPDEMVTVRISEVMKLVKASEDDVTLLVEDQLVRARRTAALGRERVPEAFRWDANQWPDISTHMTPGKVSSHIRHKAIS